MKKLAFAGALAFAAVLVLERVRPLRRQTEPKARRELRNLVVAATAGVAVQLAELPLVQPLCRRVETSRWGLLGRWRPPEALEGLLGLLLMDYTLYVWHYLTHRVPFLWRFHAVHHVDLDCDATTAIRFHFGELVIGTPWRMAQVALLGIRPRVFERWQAFVLACIVFHHSNLRLPLWLERPLGRILMTPRLHGIHHSDRYEEVNSNWSSGLAVWDWLHGTLRLDPEQDELVIGVPALRSPEQVQLPGLLAVPFRKQPEDYWSPSSLPSDLPEQPLQPLAEPGVEPG